MHKRIVQAEKELERAKQRLARAVASLQRRCKHKEVAEAEYQPSTYFMDAREPVRICLNCGMAEDGWGPGYQVLHVSGKDDTTKTISRDDLFRMRKGLHIVDKHKGPLIRKEITVPELVDKWIKND